MGNHCGLRGYNLILKNGHVLIRPTSLHKHRNKRGETAALKWISGSCKTELYYQFFSLLSTYSQFFKDNQTRNLLQVCCHKTEMLTIKTVLPCPLCTEFPCEHFKVNKADCFLRKINTSV